MLDHARAARNGIVPPHKKGGQKSFEKNGLQANGLSGIHGAHGKSNQELHAHGSGGKHGNGKDE